MRRFICRSRHEMSRCAFSDDSTGRGSFAADGGSPGRGCISKPIDQSASSPGGKRWLKRNPASIHYESRRAVDACARNLARRLGNSSLFNKLYGEDAKLFRDAPPPSCEPQSVRKFKKWPPPPPKPPM